jgi:methylthioribulose-1-phosphate dehydratase
MKKLICIFLVLPLMLFAEYSVDDICDAARKLNALGLFPATAGNLSKRINDEFIAITVSGRHKGELEPRDMTLVDAEGRSVDPTLKPSAETALHLLIYRLYPTTGAVIHTHSMAGTVLSRQRNNFVTDGYEIHKVFPGITTHESQLDLPFFENTQDYETLCRDIEEAFKGKPEPY